jgi:glycosyltransferase involved in cell wall biosynthesis
MLTVLIETQNHEEALARTLASLVGGAVDGTIREVLVCDRNSVDETRKVAELAGCHVHEDGVNAMKQAKGEWLLCLEPGSRLFEGWTSEARVHCAGGKAAACFRPSRAGFSLPSWLGGKGLKHGLLIPKAEALRLTLAGRFPPRPKIRLEARIVPADRK